MLNKLLQFSRQYRLIRPGEHIICALSGGADSVALTFALYLLKDKLDIRLSAAHFNHHLRGEESKRDEAFVLEFCHRYDIPLFAGEAEVKPGKKGLEAAARDARYAFLRGLPGKIATAHTADDNAETVLLHLVRGTGLKGLGGIAPENRNVIRPMLSVTRQDVEDFLTEWNLPHIEDSSNDTDSFLRNRLRRHVMPLLKAENPQIAESFSAMALRLRQDEACLSADARSRSMDIPSLREMHPALRSRCLETFLKSSGVPEPEECHIALAEALVFSDKPSASGSFPGGVTVARQYDALVKLEGDSPLPAAVIPCPGSVFLPDWGVRISCTGAETIRNDANTFTVNPQGNILLRSRLPGDAIRLSGGTKALKKLFIDRKIPASHRARIPVLCDDNGILGVMEIGVNLDRSAAALPAVQIHIEKEN